ncbi:MAG: hypothetical protein IPK81_06040 [Rhodospirillales bacterium]|nr:MAG: hypothetical protein IPK81_06040 [Rhodospirillales bacterium]
MDDPADGFSIDGVAYRWGTLPSAVGGVGALPGGTDYLHRAVPCASAFGLDTLLVTISSPAPDRPVMGVSYALAAVPGARRADPEHWMRPLRARFGPAAAAERADLSAYRDPSGGVAFWARWPGRAVELGLSIYGGYRAEGGGRSAGLFYVTWADAEAAAAPFLPAWRALSDSVAAAPPRSVRRFGLPGGVRPVGADDGRDESRTAWRVLHSRAVIDTPPAIRDGLQPNDLALWRAGDAGPWILSTVWDSAVLGPGGVDRITWHELSPARGGGESGLSAGGLTIRAPYGTRAVADAARALAAVPGVAVAESRGPDC